MLLPIMRQRTATYRLSQLQALIHDVSLHINAFLFDNKYLCGHMYRAFYQFFLPKKQRFSKTHKSHGQGLTPFVTTFLGLCEE